MRADQSISESIRTKVVARRAAALFLTAVFPLRVFLFGVVADFWERIGQRSWVVSVFAELIRIIP
jgi:hypothetical protein